MKQLTSSEYANTRHLLNPSREYVASVNTDIAATFKRIMEEQAAARAGGFS